jgi:hypothetical protein
MSVATRDALMRAVHQSRAARHDSAARRMGIVKTVAKGTPNSSGHSNTGHAKAGVVGLVTRTQWLGSEQRGGHLDRSAAAVKGWRTRRGGFSGLFGKKK